MRRIKLLFLLLPVFWLFNGSSGMAQYFEAGVERLRVPVEAPAFEMPVAGDGAIGLQDLKGKVALLTFVEDRCSV